MPNKSKTENNILLKWIFSWVGMCFLLVSLVGGVHCKCPNPEDENNTEPVLVRPPDCYCVAPGTACSTDADCKTKVRYCMPLVCSRGYCEEFREEDPNEFTPDDGGPEPCPNCPLTCKSNTDCNPLYCGLADYCKEGKCVDPGIVHP